MIAYGFASLNFSLWRSLVDPFSINKTRLKSELRHPSV